jgi:hypothetical protein
MDEGDPSLALRAVEAIPERRAGELANRYGAIPDQIASLSRAALRIVARAPTEQRERLIGAACKALASGTNATAVVGAVRKAEGAKAAATQEKNEKAG